MLESKSTVRLVEEQELATSIKIDENVIAGLEVVVDAHIGSTNMTIARLTQLKAGDSITLDAALNQDIELRLNGATIAFGELVTVGSNFGVRITNITER